MGALVSQTRVLRNNTVPLWICRTNSGRLREECLIAPYRVPEIGRLSSEFTRSNNQPPQVRLLFNRPPNCWHGVFFPKKCLLKAYGRALARRYFVGVE